MKNFLTASLVLIYLVAWLPAASITHALEAPTTCGSGTTPACIYFTTTATGNTVNVDASGNFTVNVMVNTGSQNSAGADVWVQFETAKLDFISDGSTYPEAGSFYPNNRVIWPITADSAGLIKMTRFITMLSPAVYTNGTGTFAQLKFHSKVAVGQTVTLSFVYTPGATANDSTVASATSGDLLGSAPSATLTLVSGSVTGILDHVEIVPASATVAPSGIQSFTATAKDSSDAAIGSGVTYAWTETGDGSVSPAAGTTTTYTAGTATGTGTVTVTATQGTVVRTASATVTISGQFNPTPPGSNPFISSIVPSSGRKDTTPQVTIYGGNFGNFDATKNKVYFGMSEATVLDWGSNRIVVRVPAAPDITANLTVTVRVATSDAKTAEHLGYTYTLAGGQLPDNGPEIYTWLGLLMSSLGMAGLAYMKLSSKKPAVQPIQLG